MSGRTIDGRVVDLGASYFTARAESPFDAVVKDWVARGLAREWTDTFAVADDGGLVESTSGPMRYGAPNGLRAVVQDLAVGLVVTFEREVSLVTETPDRVEVDGTTFDHVVLAMPDPQAQRLLASPREILDREWEPTIAVALRFDERAWPADLHGVFVKGSPDVSFIADDGDRRGDQAPVLVAHSTAALARDHLDDPAGAIAPITAAVQRILGITNAPVSSRAHRWTFARPARTHSTPSLVEGRIAVCGDAWGDKSSVETAWTSGHQLGLALAAAMG